MFINWYRPFPVMTVRIWYITNAVSVDKSNMGLTFVPRDISIQAENLNLEYNRIIRITNMSFIQCIQLHTLKLSGNDLTYIENGSFDFNAKLETLSMAGNNIMQLPHSFGAAAASLRNLHLWCALQYFSKPGDTFLSGRRLVLPRLASPGLALPCLVMPCLVLPGFECDAFSSNIKNEIHMVGLF